jgi:hypothetical protein
MTIEPPPRALDVYDVDRFAAIEEFADKAASYWRSIGEAAYRADLFTVEIHCRQVRLLTLGAFATVKALRGKIASDT